MDIREYIPSRFFNPRTHLYVNHPTQGDVGRVMCVLITDGRANISLGRSNEDPDCIGPEAAKPSGDQLKDEVRSGVGWGG